MYVNVKLEGIDEAFKVLDPRKVKSIAKTSIRRAANSGRTIISSQIREKFNLQKQIVDDKIRVNLGGLNDMLQAVLTVGSDPISLPRFRPRWVRGRTEVALGREKKYDLAKGESITIREVKRKRLRKNSWGGVFVQIWKSKTTRLPHAFIASGKGGAIQVFERIPGTQIARAGRKKPTEKLRAIKVVSYASITRKPENLPVIEARIREQLMKEFAARVKHFSEASAAEAGE